MFLGVVAPPDVENEFDGKIMIERVSKQKETRYNQHHQSFHDEYMVNNSLKKGEWRDLYNTLLHDSIDLLIQKIAFEYELEESIVPNLKLSYKEWPNGRKTAKWHRLGFGDGKLLENRTITNQNGIKRQLELTDLSLYVFRKAGTMVETDITCNSEFMLRCMDKIGQSIRTKMHFVDKDHPIYLYMDNAGGHGMNATKEAYEKMLKDNYNIIITWQCPRSPETNLLDLGIWMSLQSVVEKLHKHRRVKENVLAKTVLDSFDTMETYVKYSNIWKRWEKVLEIIATSNGGNE